MAGLAAHPIATADKLAAMQGTPTLSRLKPLYKMPRLPDSRLKTRMINATTSSM